MDEFHCLKIKNAGAHTAHKLCNEDPATTEHYFSNRIFRRFIIDFRFTKKTALVENWMNTFSSYKALGRLYDEHEDVSFYTDGIILKHDLMDCFLLTTVPLHIKTNND